MQTIPHYKPDELVYRTIINVLVNARRMNVAEAVFEEFLNSSFVPSHDDYVTLMSGYTKCGSLRRGVSVLQKMKDASITPLVSAYNVLLEGCNRSIRGQSLSLPFPLFVVSLFRQTSVFLLYFFLVYGRLGYGSSASRANEKRECGPWSNNVHFHDQYVQS